MSDEVVVGEGPAFARELPKEGSCVARVWKSFNVGLQSWKGSAPSPKLILYFILPYTYTEGEFKGKRMLAKVMYTAGFGKADAKKPTWLRRDIQLILNRKITDEEVKSGFKMNREVAGKCCMVHIVHKENGYADVDSVMSLPEGVPGLAANPFADPKDDYTPDYVKKLRENALVQERVDTDKVAEKGWNQTDRPPAPPMTPAQEKEALDIY